MRKRHRVCIAIFPGTRLVVWAGAQCAGVTTRGAVEFVAFGAELSVELVVFILVVFMMEEEEVIRTRAGNTQQEKKEKRRKI